MASRVRGWALSEGGTVYVVKPAAMEGLMWFRAWRAREAEDGSGFEIALHWEAHTALGNIVAASFRSISAHGTGFNVRQSIDGIN